MQGAIDYLGRRRRAADALRRAGVDALLLTPGPDLYYLTGFEHGHAGERLLGLVLRADGSVQWIVPAMNVAQVKPHAAQGEPIRAWTDPETYVPALRAALGGLGSLAFDDESRAAFLLDVLESSKVRVQRASSVLRALRIRKDATERELLRRAGQTVDRAIPEAVALCRPGRTEGDVDRDLRALLKRLSPESSVAFTIIASGPNSALPHHETAERVLRSGDVVVVDYGTRRLGYLSDITVTCGVGRPADGEVDKVYATVREAQRRAVDAVRPGVTCGEVDHAARSVIERAGYGPHFLHRTGHGLGVQGHEPPFMVAGNNERLEEGMVFSIEPGIYLPDRFGVRLEIIVAVSSDGVELLNRPSADRIPSS
jgi:D-alanyl-D-alanine dipeptidase